MSIWHTIWEADPCYEVAYGWPREGDDDRPSLRSRPLSDSLMTVDSAPDYYGHEGLRVTLSEGDERHCEAVLDRKQIERLHGALTVWLG